MKGFYCYCVLKNSTDIEEMAGGETIYDEGIDPRFPITIVKYKDIGTAVSKVFLTEFNEENFHEHLEHNLQWIEDKARRHLLVQEIISKGYITVPLRFYTIYNSKQNILNIMAENYYQFYSLLEKVKHKSEWTLKLYLDKNIFKEKMKYFQKKELELELVNKPPGVAYLLRKKYHEVLEQEIDNKLAQIINKLHKNVLYHYSTEIMIEDNLSKEITGRDKEMVLKCSLLIPNHHGSEFIREIEKINVQQSTSGLLLELSGPWPPYSFTSIDLAT